MRKNGVRIDVGAFKAASPERDYWVGMLFADGCIGRYIVSLSLSSADEKHVRRFAGFLRMSPMRVTGYPGSNQVSARVSCRPLAEYLGAEFGLVPRKTWCAVAPSSMLESRDFWRGYIDGDGSISKYRGRKYTSGAATAWASVQAICHPGSSLVEQFSAYAKARVDAGRVSVLVSRGGVMTERSGRTYDYTANTYKKFTVTGQAAIKLLSILYQPGDVALERKAERARAWIDAPAAPATGFRYSENSSREARSREGRLWHAMRSNLTLKTEFRARLQSGEDRATLIDHFLAKLER